MSRLIKSQWSNCTSSDKKVISIKTVNTFESMLDLQDVKSKSPIEIIEDARKEADDILLQAQKERADIFAQVQQEKQNWAQERQQLVEAAQKEGFQQGRKEGNQQGYAEYLERLEDAKEITLSARNDYNTYLESSEKTILDLSIKIAEKVIDSKLEENHDYFLSLLKKAIKEVKEHPNVQIYVHPINYQEILTKKEELQSILPHQSDLFIYPDQDLSTNGCIIQSDYGRIDAGIDTQLLEIKRKLGECLEREYE